MKNTAKLLSRKLAISMPFVLKETLNTYLQRNVPADHWLPD